MARSKRSGIVSQSTKVVKTGFNDINSLFRQTSNTILGLASKGFKTLKSKRRRSGRSKRSKKTRRH